MDDAAKEAFKEWAVENAIRTDLGSREAWQAALEWRDSQNTLWRNAAIRVGEDLHSVGPNNYYNMSSEEWLNWALSTIYSKPNFVQTAAQINQQMIKALEDIAATGYSNIDRDKARAALAAVKEQAK